MDIGLLTRFFGTEQHWHGACTIILDAEANVNAVGADAIGTGGSKFYAPRTVSGRVFAEAVCLLKDGSAVVMFQQHRSKTATGEEIIKHTLTVADPRHIIAVEFSDNVPQVLQTLGVSMPATALRPASSGSHAGVQTRPRPV